jgi:serine/threonine-protein kinase
MYRRCVGAGKCGPPNSNQSATRDSYYGNSEFDNYPVIYVSWTDAKNYCEWAERRLPTEAEWEKAASWNSEQEEKYVFPWGDSINCSFANYNGTDSDCNKDTAPVETYPTGHSPYGALNMAGNVWEWVSTLYGPYPYAPNENRENPSDSGARILRGGAWSNIDASLRSANRVKADATAFSNDIGFRCAVSATQ